MEVGDGGDGGDGGELDPVNRASSADPLARVLVLLLKGVVERDQSPATWSQLTAFQARARDYLSVIGLDLVIDEAEGYAFVRSRDRSVDAGADESDLEAALPRLVVRRQLSFPVSLLIALIRRKLAEFDATGGDTRLVLTRDEVVELVRVFLPQRADEAKLFNQIDAHISKVVDLGFLRRLAGTAGAAPSFEVRRIIKAFVDAQWLSELNERLAGYRESLERDLDASQPALVGDVP